MFTYYYSQITIPSDKQDFHAQARRLPSDIMNLFILFSWWYFIGVLGVSRTDWSDAVCQ